jgi:prepilin-type N-terminal cleavage/methylation domain-containing protein
MQRFHSLRSSFKTDGANVLWYCPNFSSASEKNGAVPLAAPRPRNTFVRSAFTLVEMLVVISIIGLLAALAARGIMGALNTAKNTAIKAEIDQIDGALKAFKEKYGSYPPCDLRITGGTLDNNPGLKLFLARAFQRYNPNASKREPVSGSNMIAIAADLSTAGIDYTKFEPAKALVFWLNGLSPDPTNPIAGGGTRIPFFSFDKTRLIGYETYIDNNGNGIYDSGDTFPTGGDANNNNRFDIATGYKMKYGTLPLVYLDYRSYMVGATRLTNGDLTGPILSLKYLSAPSYVIPYLSQAPTGAPSGNARDKDFINPDSYQLIACGQDSLFGDDPQYQATTTAPSGATWEVGTTKTSKIYPAGTGYTSDDLDNVANFSEKSSLGDAKP